MRSKDKLAAELEHIKKDISSKFLESSRKIEEELKTNLEMKV